MGLVAILVMWSLTLSHIKIVSSNGYSIILWIWVESTHSDYNNLDSTLFKNSIFQKISYLNALESKFDFDVK